MIPSFLQSQQRLSSYLEERYTQCMGLDISRLFTVISGTRSLMQGTSSQNGLPQAPVLLKFRSSKWLIGFAVFTATFTDGFLYSIIVPVLPFTLVSRSGVAPEMVQFWITLLFVVFGTCMLLGAPLTGWISKYSPLRQGPLIGGLLSALASTLLFMFATKTWVLVVARGFQGLSAGVVYTTVLALVVETVRRDEVGSWIGFALSGVNLGTLIAPALAGLVYDKVGYHAVFIMCLAVIAFDLVLALVMVDKRRASKWLADCDQEDNSSKHRNPSHLDSPDDGRDGLADSNCLPSPGSDVENGRSSHKTNDAGKQGGSQHLDEESPLLADTRPIAKTLCQRWFPATAALLASPGILAALYGCFVNSLLIASFDAVLPHFVQSTFDWSSSGAGTIFLAITVPSLLNPLFGTLSDRYGRRIVALSGFALTVPSLALLGLVRHAELSDKVVLGVLLVLIGTGMNSFLTSLVTDMSFEVERLQEKDPEVFGDAGAYIEAYAMVDAMFGAGAVVGPLASGLLYDKTNWAITAGVLAICCFSGIIPVILYTHGSKHNDNTLHHENHI